MSWRCIACGRLLCGCVVVGPASATPPVAVVDERQLALDLDASDGAGGRVVQVLRDVSRLEPRRVAAHEVRR